MSYEILRVETLDEEFIGFVVWKLGTSKLEDSNIWLPGEGVENHIVRLNELALLKEHWPDARDAEVVAMIEDPDFEPLVYEDQENAAEPGELMPALKDPSQPIKRYNSACEIVARRRANG